MSAEDERGGPGVDPRALLRSVVEAYRYMETSIERYAVLVLLPGLSLSLTIGGGAVLASLPLFVTVLLVSWRSSRRSSRLSTRNSLPTGDGGRSANSFTSS
jgi:hypothetical protein